MGWWRRLIRRNAIEHELDAELRYDFDRRVDDFIASGLSREDARRAAILEFGGLDQIKERCRDARGTRWMEDVLADVRYALRLLGRDRTFAAVAIAALGSASPSSARNSRSSRRTACADSRSSAPIASRSSGCATGSTATRGCRTRTSSTSAVLRRHSPRRRRRARTSVSLGDSGQAADSVLAAFVSGPTLRVLGRAPAIGRDFRDEDAGSGAQPPFCCRTASGRRDTTRIPRSRAASYASTERARRSSV